MSDPSSDPSPAVAVAGEHTGGRTFMDMNGYQWTVLFARDGHSRRRIG